MLIIDIFSSSAFVILPSNCKKTQNLARLLQEEYKILRDSCKKNAILARILQDKSKNYVLSFLQDSCMILNSLITRAYFDLA